MFQYLHARSFSKVVPSANDTLDCWVMGGRAEMTLVLADISLANSASSGKHRTNTCIVLIFFSRNISTNYSKRIELFLEKERLFRFLLFF